MGAKMSPKRFKQFDQQFASLRNTFYSQEHLVETISRDAAEFKFWPWPYNQPSVDAVREAVYLCDSAVEWQKFRVSLKGQSTALKIARLFDRYIHNLSQRHHEDVEFKREVVRINNYIGALVRGGQLSTNLEILK